MTRINLLPWRESKRLEQNRIFYVIYASVLLVVVFILLVIYLYFDMKVNQQIRSTEILQSQLNTLSFKIQNIRELEKEKQALINQDMIVKTIKTERNHVVHLFNSIVEAVPEGLFLNQITRKGTRVTFLGEAQSNQTISTFIKQLKAFPWFSNPVLSEIKSEFENIGQTSGSGFIKFVLEIDYQAFSTEKEKSTK